MHVTWQNYKALLGPALRERFKQLVYNAKGRAVIYKDNVLRYADVDEQHELLY